MLRRIAIGSFSAALLIGFALPAFANGRDGLPNPRRGTGQGTAKLVAGYTPPDNGGPAKTGGSGARWA